MNPEDLRKLINSKTRLIILNSPSNPTGAMMTKEELCEVVSIADKNDIYILSDEIYSRMIFDENDKFFSPGTIDSCRERVIIANGFSKAFAMTGWRVGVCIGPKTVIDKMMLVVQTINSCVPPFIQDGAYAAINNQNDEVKKMMLYYKKNRDLLVAGLNSINGITTTVPKGAIYCFPNITETGMNSSEFTNFLLNNCSIAVLPGHNFGEQGEGYVRFSFTTQTKNIYEAIDRLKNTFGEKL